RGLTVEAVRASGGGARSPLWRHILADVLNARVALTLAEAGPAFGAAILAGVGVGAFPSVAEAASRLVELRDELAPDAAMAARYRRYHQLYDGLYPQLRGHYAAVARLLADSPAS